jgi:DNA repair protein RecO (recombination protein O)
VQWELGLLAELGFGLELSRCAATGRNDALAYVSPRTGHAVSLAAGEPYKDRLLPLPRFLATPGALPGDADILAGLALAGHFLERHAFAALHREVPAARAHLVDRLKRALRRPVGAGSEAASTSG